MKKALVVLEMCGGRGEMGVKERGKREGGINARVVLEKSGKW